MPTFLVSDSISLAESAGRNLVVVTTDNRSAGDLLFLSDSGVAHLASNLGQRGNIDYDQIRRSARSGDGDKLHTLDIGGTKVLGNTVKFDSAGNLIDAGVTPGGGGGSGALILLEQHTASSSATLNFTTCITSTYDEYLIEFINVLPATNATNIMMRCSTNGGSSYDSSAIYDFEESYFFSSNSGGGAINSNQTAFQLLGSISNSATVPSSGNWRFFPSSTSAYKMLYGNRSTYNTAVGSNLLGGLTVAYYKSTTAVNAFQFYSSSGNIASGTVRVYGLAKTTVASPDFILVNGA